MAERGCREVEKRGFEDLPGGLAGRGGDRGVGTGRGAAGRNFGWLATRTAWRPCERPRLAWWMRVGARLGHGRSVPAHLRDPPGGRGESDGELAADQVGAGLAALGLLHFAPEGPLKMGGLGQEHQLVYILLGHITQEPRDDAQPDVA